MSSNARPPPKRTAAAYKAIGGRLVRLEARTEQRKRGIGTTVAVIPLTPAPKK